MKSVLHFLDHRRVRKAAGWMAKISCFLSLLCLLCLFLAVIGRLTFSLVTSGGNYDKVICAQKDHTRTSRSFVVTLDDRILVSAEEQEQIGPAVQAGLSLTAAVHFIPIAAAYWCLWRVFINLENGQILLLENARFLVCCGLIHLFLAILAPSLKIAVCRIFSLIAKCSISISPQTNLPGELILTAVFFAGAWLIRTGIRIQNKEPAGANLI